MSQMSQANVAAWEANGGTDPFRPDDRDSDSPLEWSELWAVLDANRAAGRIVWVETTEEMYHEMLGVLPPARQVWAGFLVGEPCDHTPEGKGVYRAFTCRAGKYEACSLTAAEFRKLVG